MYAEPSRSAGVSPATGRLFGLIRIRYALAVYIVCGHEHRKRDRVTSPDCRAAVRTFPLYRDLAARR
jgi:hypothetical protein